MALSAIWRNFITFKSTIIMKKKDVYLFYWHCVFQWGLLKRVIR